MASFDEVIPPGKAGTIRSAIHTGALRGAVAKGITVTHDDPTQGPVALSVRAEVVGSIEFLPMPMISLAPKAKSGVDAARVIVRKEASETGKLAITDIKPSVPWMKVTARTVTAPEPAGAGLPEALPGDTILSVDATGAPVGGHAEVITFSTGLTRERSATLPVRIVVRGPLLVQPRELLLNPDTADASHATGQLLAMAREDLDPRKIVVATDSPAFSVRTEPAGERGYKVIVDWKRANASGPTEGTIRLSLGDEVTSVPVRVNLARAPSNPTP